MTTPTTNELAACKLCHTPFDDGLHADCGGDCLLCMAEGGDPDCIEQAFNLLLTARREVLAQGERLHRFINAAASEGLWLDGVDAGDLYVELFPKAHAAAIAQAAPQPPSCPRCGEQNPAEIHTCSPQKPTSTEPLQLAELRDRVSGMQETAYTYGEYSKEAVRIALDGVLDVIDELYADPQTDRVAELEAEVAKLRKALTTAITTLDRDGDEWGICGHLRAAIAAEG